MLALVGVRKAMDYIFTQRDLYWLDHLLPDEQRQKIEDLAKVMEEGARENKVTEIQEFEIYLSR